MLNFAICDDNVNILDRLQKLLETIFTKNNFEAQVCFKFDNVEDLLTCFDNNKDVYLIFTTAHLEYAMVAYRYKTFDYLPKPITYDRLEDTIKRLFEDIYGLPKKYIKIDNKNTLVDANEIQYICRDGMKLIFHTSSRDYDIYSSFNKIRSQLPDSFVRCHKSYMVNTGIIKDVDPVALKVQFDKNSYCYIGPKYKNSFMEVMKRNGIIE